MRSASVPASSRASECANASTMESMTLRLGTGEGGAAIGAVGGGEISAIGLAAYRAAENLPRKTDLLPKMLMVMRPLALAAAHLSTLFAGPPAHARPAHRPPPPPPP